MSIWKFFKLIGKLILIVIIYRSPERGAQIDSLFLAVVCNNLSRLQSTKNIAHRFSFLFLSHRPFEALFSVYAAHLSVSSPSVRPYRHFFASFHIICDEFLFIFTSFVMYFRPFHITFLIALPPLSIYNFTSNNHSFFFYLF